MYQSRKGFSLIELLIVIVVIAALAAVIVPSSTGVKDAADGQKIIAAAENLNLAMTRYKINTGVRTWQVTDPEARYALLAPYMDFAPATLAEYNSRYGATYSIGALNQKVGVSYSDSSGAVHNLGSNY
ncbi:MAG: prepilin-type N-terminal cleavage/methylation domain-containing protein [Opitutales bacterium]|nr:prepilin-type N-terminal cleavage/methylation domain-containing protein [Opitutales bacterium]